MIRPPKQQQPKSPETRGYEKGENRKKTGKKKEACETGLACGGQRKPSTQYVAKQKDRQKKKT